MRTTSGTDADAIPPPNNNAQDIVEALVILGGVRMVGHVRRLVEMFQSEGYPEAAARWNAIATIMEAVVAEAPVGGDLDSSPASRLPSC